MTNVNIFLKEGLNYVMIFNSCNKLIYNKKVNNKLNICLKINCCYKIIIINSTNTLITTFIVNKNNNNYYFNYSNNIIKNLSLTDYYYKNLPIEKGEINLWQKQ